MDRSLKVANLVREKAALFLAKKSSGASLITVTRVSISPDLKRATVFITVLPDEKEKAALFFVKRQLGELRSSLKEEMSSKVIPVLDVALDKGEKHRRKIDELLREK